MLCSNGLYRQQGDCMLRAAICSRTMTTEDSTEKSEGAREIRKSNNQLAMALELPFVLVGTVGLAVLLGFYLDRWLHTKPVLTLILGALGFIGGIREIIRRVK
jgi:F0F1-type ATP synthase assembly protein I